MYNGFPGDGQAPHFFFSQSVTPMEPGNLYEVSTRHDSSASAIRDAMIIPIKLHGKGVPSAGEYVEMSKLTHVRPHRPARGRALEADGRQGRAHVRP